MLGCSNMAGSVVHVYLIFHLPHNISYCASLLHIIFSQLCCRWYAVVRLDLLVVHFRTNRLVMLRRGGTSQASMSDVMRSFRPLLPRAVTLPCCSWPSDQRPCYAYAASNSISGH